MFPKEHTTIDWRAMLQIGSEDPIIDTEIEIHTNRFPKKPIEMHLALKRNDTIPFQPGTICQILPERIIVMHCFQAFPHILSEDWILGMCRIFQPIPEGTDLEEPTREMVSLKIIKALSGNHRFRRNVVFPVGSQFRRIRKSDLIVQRQTNWISLPKDWISVVFCSLTIIHDVPCHFFSNEPKLVIERLGHRDVGKGRINEIQLNQTSNLLHSKLWNERYDGL